MFKKLTPTLLVACILVGCAKEKSYEKVYKEPEQLKKSAFKLTEKVEETVMGLDGKKTTVVKEVPVKYMYVPMTLGTPMQVAGAKPFYQGTEKVVKLQWSKEGLEVVEIEKDERFQDNELNEFPVMTIPGEYAKYQCAEDEYGDCTNEEEEDDEVTWEKKTHFTPDYADVKLKEVNFLDAVGVEGNGCFSLQNTRVVDYEISDGVVNIELEKTYSLKNIWWPCIRYSMDWNTYSINSSSFKVKHFYSLVELKQLATPGYEPVTYPIPDHSVFGFFKNQDLVVNDNYDSQRKEWNLLLNRFAPNRKNNELVYHLSSTYSKPKNKALLKATYNAADIINKGFSSANVPFRLKLVEQKDPATEVSPGDLRYNTIVLIEDPLANGLLGYGPSVSNPYTGEIIQAHTNMYGGVLTSTVRRTYQAAVDLSNDRLKKNPLLEEGYTVAKEALSMLPATLASDIATAKEEAPAPTTPAAAAMANFNNMMAADLKIDTNAVKFPEFSSEERLKNFINYSDEKIDNILKIRMAKKVDIQAKMMLGEDALKSFDELEKRTHKELEDKFGKSIGHKHTVEEFPIAGTHKVIHPDLFKVAGISNADGTLKPWTELSKMQKEKVKEIVLVKAYTSTLIHEIGHNLGLRHNFSGSTDKDNFMSKEEAQSLGMTDVPAYSSIMDYAASDYNELRSLGKYDMAALRFAYAREVEMQDGSVQKINGSVAALDDKIEELEKAGEKVAKRKTYSFCTDENAGLSSLCNRFDEGTTLVEVAKYRIKRYKDMYKYRNFRDGRLDFSAYDIYGYAMYRNLELSQIRDILEEYEFFAGIFGEQTMSSGCSPEEVSKYPICSRINDYRDAVRIVGDFFIEILKTPDHLCAVVNVDKPTVIVKYEKLSELYEKVKYDIDNVTTSCFDPAIAEHINKESKGLQKVVGENGKFLNGIKDTNPNYRYVTDRAVLGTWPDKVFAMKSLFKRRWRNGSTDSNQMALIDVPYIQEKAIGILTHYAAGEALTEPLPFTTAEGNKFVVPYVIGNDNKIEQIEDGYWWLKLYFGMDISGKNNFSEIALKQINYVGVLHGEDTSEVAFNAGNLVSIVKQKGYIAEDSRIPGQAYFFNGIDTTYHGNSVTPIANIMLSSIVEKDYLDKQDKALIAEVFMLRTQPEAPADLSDNHKVFFGLPESLQTQLLGLSGQGAQIPVAAFIQVLGETDGPIVHAVYNEGLVVMKAIVDTKTQIMTTPRNPGEAKLFSMPIDILGQYLQGSLTDDLVEFYKGQLNRLPKFKSSTDDSSLENILGW